MTKNQLPPVLRRWRFIAAVMGVTALAGGGVLLAANSDPATAMSFHNLPSSRVLDIRAASQVGAFSTPLGAASTIDFVVPGLPDDATSVSLNVTVTDGTHASFLVVYPSGDTRPGTSTVNWDSANAVANTATVNVAANHSLRVYNDQGSVNVIVDLLGYYAPTPAGGGTGTGPQGPPGPAGSAAFLYATSTSPQTLVNGARLAFDLVNAETPGAYSTDVLDDAFTAIDAGVYKVSFGMTSVSPAQVNLEVDGLDPLGGSLVFGGDAGAARTATGGTAVVTLTAGQTITLVNETSATDIELDSPVGGTGGSLTAWILIEKLS
jgi:hypothetical protein